MAKKNVEPVTPANSAVARTPMQQDPVVNTVEQAPVQQEASHAPYTLKEFDQNQIVTVRNGFQGKLIYQSRKTGEVFVWNNFGDEQDMELSELRNARSSSKKFFVNNWFMIDDPAIIDYLGMSRYYKYALPIDDFDDFFKRDVAEIVSVVSKMSEGQKKSVAYRARQLIKTGEIDSNRVIRALEESLNIELIER